MKQFNLVKASLLLILSLFSTLLFAQVKIGGDPGDIPHASAVLELKSADRGFLLPRLTQQQMMDMASPAEALLIYNTDSKGIYIYSIEQMAWKHLGSDSAEWKYDSVAKRVYLVKGYPVGDSVFYEPLTKKFVFSDRTTNTNSIGQEFPVTAFTGKYYFKATASRFTDTANANPTAMNVNFEVDSSGFNSSFRGMQVATVNNPKNNDPLTVLNSLSLATIHAGADTLLSLTGINNSTTINGKGGTNNATGFTNTVGLLDSSLKNIITLSGIRNNLINTSPNSKILGNAYGYFGSAALLDTFGLPMVNANVYGVFLGNILGAQPKHNYAYYSNKGHNRFGDSTLITESGFNSPRAILDINSPTAMIIPTGSTLQRPATPITGMLRYNTTNQTVEAYSGSQWNGILRGTTTIDLAILNPATGATITGISVPGATLGSVVSVSPVNALPGGIVIAWARVSLADQVEIRFENNNGTAVDPPSQSFNIRVIQ